MADYINIFVEADISLQKLVTIVESILDIKKQRFLDEYEPMYELHELHTVVLISENTFFNDDDVNVEDYHYQIDLRSLHNFQSIEEANGWQDQRARYLYDQLKARGHYRLLLTKEVYTKIEEFVPAQYNTIPSELAYKAQTLPTEIAVYVVGDLSLSELAKELEHLLVVSALPRSNNHNSTWYEFRGTKAWFFLSQNTSSGRFSAYSYIIEIKGHVYIPGERRYWQYESAKSLFEQLKETGRYTLALVGDTGDLQLEDQERVLDEFVPEGR